MPSFSALKQPSLNDKRFKQIFETSTVAQWVVDIVPVQNLLKRLQFSDFESLERAIEADPQLIEQLRIATRIAAANEAAAKLFHTNDVEQWRSEIVKLMRRSDLLNMAKAVLSVGDEGQHISFQVEVATLDRETKYLWLSTEIPPSDALERGLVVSALDVSAVKAAQAELEEQHHFLSTIIRTLPDVLFVYDFSRQQRIFENEDLIQVLGYDKDLLKEKGENYLSHLIHPDDKLSGEAMQAMRDSLSAGEVYEATVRFLDAGGYWRSYYFRSSALDFDAKKGLELGLVVARDVTEVLATQQGLAEKERRYRQLADNFSDVVITTDENLHLDYASPSIEALVGLSSEAFLAQEQRHLKELIGWAEFEHEIKAEYQAALEQTSAPEACDEGYLRLYQTNIEHADGHLIPVEIKISLLRGADQELQGLMILCRDISARLKIQQDLKLAAKVFENSLEGIYITDPQGFIAQVNPAFSKVTGYDAETAIGQRPAFLSSGWHGQYFANEIKPELDKSGHWQGEVINRRSSGEVFPAWVGISEVRDEQQELLGHITSFRDITESKHTQERIHKLAYFDPLTELPNRSLFHDRLGQALQRAERTDTNFALLFLDLDRFKAVNDSMGHEIGDQLLKEASERLNHCIRADDTVARMGGDEFTVILSGLADREAAESASVQISLKIMNALNKPFFLGGCELFISTSIGIALYPFDGREETSLLKNADTAMYHAKNVGKNGYQFYSEAMNARSMERLELQTSLHKAVNNEEFEMVFQPIYQLDNSSLTGIEAFLRWNHPEKGVIEPEDFISIAKETGLIIKLGEWAIRKACAQMAAWLSMGCDIGRIAVNISALQFSDGNLVRTIIDAIDESGISPHQLELEVTETMLMADFGFSLAMLEDLKALGVRISVDDFGTGSSSLNYLKRLPIDCLKIDKSFVANLHNSSDDRRITRAIIALADSFHLKVVAEGVENQKQAQHLLEMGCEEGQGYLLGKPLLGRTLTSMLLTQAAERDGNPAQS